MASPVIVTTPRPAPWFTPAFVAVDRGLLAEEGIEAVIQYGTDMEQLTRGEVDFVVTGAGRGGLLTTADVRMICGHSTRDTGHVLMVRPQVGSAGAVEHLVMDGTEGLVNELRNILAHHGVDLTEADIVLTNVEGKVGHPGQYRLLKEGIGDGAPLGPPWWIFLAKEGYVNLGGEADYSPGLSGSGVFVNPEKLARDPQQARAFVRAYVRSINYCQENLPGTLETMLKYSSAWGVDNPEIARDVYNVVSPYWTAEVDVQAVDKLLRQTAEKLGIAPRPVESFVDLRFLEEALAS